MSCPRVGVPRPHPHGCLPLIMSDSPAEERSPEPSKAGAAGSRRLFSYYAFQLLNQFIRICGQLVLVPLFLASWGPELYKDWVVVSSVAIFLGICDFGISIYFRNRFIELIARGDLRTFHGELGTALTCAASIGFAVLVAAYGGLAGHGLGSMLNAAAMSKATMLGCLIVMTLPISFSFCESVLRAIYFAEGDFSRGECVYAIYGSTQLGAVAVALALKMTPLAVASIYVVTPLMLLVGVIVDVRRRYPDVVQGFRIPSLAALRRIVPSSLLFFTSPLSLSLVQSGPIILFGMLGVPAVPVLSYTLLRTVTGLARQAAYTVAVGTGIEMARNEARGERDRSHRLYHLTGQIVAGLVGLFGGFVLWAATPFLAIWTHGTVPSDPALVLCFLGGLLLTAPGQASLMLLNYTNTAKPLAIAWCSQAAFGLALSAILVPSFGVAAAALGFAATESVAVGLFLPIVVQRCFGFSAWQLLARGIAVGVLAFGWSALVAKLAFELNIGGFTGLAAMGALWGVIAAPPVALLILPPRHRKTLLSRIHALAACLV